ncbi:MAG: hypothetical protein FWF46_06385 [Oscillospiraceae bacterium]|nr:hypothetical protein [Oscillospiraceae bacterium]
MTLHSKIISDFTEKTNSVGKKNVLNEVSSMQRDLIYEKEQLQALQKRDLSKLLALTSELKDVEDVLDKRGFRPIQKIRAYQKARTLSQEIRSVNDSNAPALPTNNFIRNINAFFVKRANSEEELFKIDKFKEEIAKKEKKIADIPKQITDKMNEFDRNEVRRYSAQGFDKTEMQIAASEEYLSSLSMGDYIANLGRLPGDVLTHVTRQGIRDHTGMFWHSAGGGENSDGFKGILQRGKLLTALQGKIERGMDLPQALGRGYMLPQLGDKNIYSTREEMLYLLDEVMENPNNEPSSIGGAFGNLFDETSVHFGVKGVLDNYYGGEKGNEIFLVFPQAMATQTEYQGTLFEESDIYSNRNDIGLLPKDGKGIPIEAGLIFIPKNARVDPQTGSKYKIIDGKGKSIADDEEKFSRQYELAENTISSQEYWENYIKNNCQGLQLKVVYYDAKDEPTEALQKFLIENGLENKRNAKDDGGHFRFYDQTEQKKYDEFKRDEDKRQQNFVERDTLVKAHMEKVIDKDTIKEAINKHYDMFEKDPRGLALLKEHMEDEENKKEAPIYDENGKNRYLPKIETMEEYHQRRLKEELKKQQTIQPSNDRAGIREYGEDDIADREQ